MAVRGSARRLLMKSMFLIERRHLCIFCALSEGTVVAAPQLAGGQSLQVLRVDGSLTRLDENTISISTSISILISLSIPTSISIPISISILIPIPIPIPIPILISIPVPIAQHTACQPLAGFDVRHNLKKVLYKRLLINSKYHPIMSRMISDEKQTSKE